MHNTQPALFEGAPKELRSAGLFECGSRGTRTLSFTVEGEPVPQGSARAFTPKGWRRPVITSDNPRLKDWRTVVALAAGNVSETELGGEILTGPIRLALTFRLPRPASLAKRVTEHTKKPDIDKLCRAIGDALASVIYRDDAQVIELVARKTYAPGAAGVDIVVEEVSR